MNCTSNVIVSTPLFKTDFAGHTKTFQKNVDLYGSCGGSPAAGDHTNVFTGNKCVGSASPAVGKDGSCSACKQPGEGGDCALINTNMYYTLANGSAPKTICGDGFVEAGSQSLPIPADGGIALAREALGM